LPQVARVLDAAEVAYNVRAAVEGAFELGTCDVYTILVELDDLARAIGALEPLVGADAAASRAGTAARRRALGLASLRGAAQLVVRRLLYVGQTVRGAPYRIEREHEVCPSGWSNPNGWVDVFISGRFSSQAASTRTAVAGTLEAVAVCADGQTPFLRRRRLLWMSDGDDDEVAALVYEMLVAVAAARVEGAALINLVACGWLAFHLIGCGLIQLARRFRGAVGGVARVDQVSPPPPPPPPPHPPRPASP